MWFWLSLNPLFLISGLQLGHFFDLFLESIDLKLQLARHKLIIYFIVHFGKHVVEFGDCEDSVLLVFLAEVLGSVTLRLQMTGIFCCGQLHVADLTIELIAWRLLDLFLN
jgi:hypothetical protein